MRRAEPTIEALPRCPSCRAVLTAGAAGPDGRHFGCARSEVVRPELVPLPPPAPALRLYALEDEAA